MIRYQLFAVLMCPFLFLTLEYPKLPRFKSRFGTATQDVWHHYDADGPRGFGIELDDNLTNLEGVCICRIILTGVVTNNARVGLKLEVKRAGSTQLVFFNKLDKGA
ncbi:hypothetical protein R6Q57_026503 [Mikania cordata]